MSKASTGIVYLVGAGPGDPGLFTLKGKQCLEIADVVIYDFLANSALLELAPQARLIYAGKRGGKKSMLQNSINQKLVKFAKAGKVVVRLKGGDPVIFSRGSEEAEILQKNKIPFEFVPGVTSGISAPIYAGIPLTHRNFSSDITFVTAHEDPTKPAAKVHWESLARAGGTIVIYMGTKNLHDVAKVLIQGGKSKTTPVALIQWGTYSYQKVVTGTLSDIATKLKKHKLKSPVMTVIGDVVQLRETLNWFESKPLFGKTILTTRSRTQSSVLKQKLMDLGAEVLSFPTIQIKKPKSTKRLDAAIKKIDDYDWLVFTSANGVQGFMDRIFALGKDVRILSHVKLAVIGSATGEALRKYSLEYDLMPKRFVAEELFDAFKKKGILKGSSKRFLLARQPQARDFLPIALKKAGARVDEVAPYMARKATESGPGIREAIQSGRVDAITFTSSQITKNFHELLGVSGRGALRNKGKKVKIFSIGPITSKTARTVGFKLAGEAKEYTIQGLVDCVTQKLGNKS
jgi:uroporphyrinogen III methyltransferase/synthase